MISFYRISPYILEISWHAEISEGILAEMISFKGIIKERYGYLLKDCVSGYHSLSLLFHKPYDKSSLILELQTLYKEVDTNKPINGSLWKIPVLYNGKDLETFSISLEMSIDEIVNLHTGNEYLIHFYGFMPGFVYLGGLDPRLHHARKENPDKTVPAGSVAIGGRQTGIYPMESPGGWHIIGNCPIKLFDPNKDPAVWANEGDKISFYSVEQKEYDHMKLLGNGLIKESTYG